MKKYMVIYHCPPEAFADMGESTPEEMAEGMKPWMVWAEKCGEQLVDMGNPLMGGQNMKPDGARSDSGRGVAGYSIMQGEDSGEVMSLLEGHPHLMWRNDCEIEVHEISPLPGA